MLSASIGLRTCSSLICNASVQFQMKIRKISRRRSRSPKYPELGHFTLLFCRGLIEMYKELKRTCTAIVLLIKPFVWWRSRCRCRRGLLKVPNTASHDNPEQINLWVFFSLLYEYGALLDGPLGLRRSAITFPNLDTCCVCLVSGLLEAFSETRRKQSEQGK